MSLPAVCAVILANGRPEMAARAKACWHSQNYAGEKRILIYNNNGDRSIGALRNAANAQTDAEILIHWDSDDWSHPNRIAEQVALLQSSGAECVGYNEMLFCASFHPMNSTAYVPCEPEAWLYRASIPNYAIGTSMCYWRDTWERNPFPDRSEGCDDLEWFNRGVVIQSVPAFGFNSAIQGEPHVPRMIASIHGGNTCSKIDAKAREWRRVPQWDAYCRTEMAL